MKLDVLELEKKAGDVLRGCFESVPFAKISKTRREVSGEEGKPDLVLTVELASGTQEVIAEIKTNGQPRFAREAVSQLLSYQADTFPRAYGVLIAPYISPRAGDLCKAAGVGYVDLSGNCRICFGTVYIEREGKPNRFARKQDLRSLYSPKGERVLRVLLMNPGKAWKMQSLATEADISLGQASNVKNLLNNREWIRVTPQGFVLAALSDLLAEWAENYSYRRNEVRDFYSLKKVSEMEADLAEVCDQEGIEYALTGFSGAARLAPMVRYSRAFAYVEQITENFISAMGFQEVSSGSNISLLTPYDKGVFYGRQEIEGVQIAGSIQIYLDLVGYKGRGEEAAEALMREVIGPSW